MINTFGLLLSSFLFAYCVVQMTTNITLHIVRCFVCVSRAIIEREADIFVRFSGPVAYGITFGFVGMVYFLSL